MTPTILAWTFAALFIFAMTALVLGYLTTRRSLPRESTTNDNTVSYAEASAHEIAVYEGRIRELTDQMTKEREHHAAEMAGYTERVRAEYRALEVQMRSEYDKAVAQMREAFDKREHDKDLERAQTVRADRRQSNARSRSSLVAKIAEHISPLLDGFPYNFKEVRHIGELFDFLIFVGLEEGHVDEIVFLEIKTRKGGRVSNQREKMIRDAISCGRVRYEVWTPNVKQIEIASEELPDAPSE